MRLRRSRGSDRAVILQAASVCLSYPDDDVLAMMPLLDAALTEQPDGDAASCQLREFVAYVRETDPMPLRQQYIDTFDLSRKHTLYLTYWSAGDTRRRGAMLGEFKQRYRDGGFLVDLRGELPDHLPIVLEFAARVDPRAGTDLLTEHRQALELLRLSLIEQQSRYAQVVGAVCTTLPGVSPTDRQAVMAMRDAPTPIETVGLEPFDPRLLPITPSPVAPESMSRAR
ncbi:nitrate reductase molybdenum cofactor assembly chaperone [Gordonia sp. LSe1-13]|uniref:Nitrate reductase molybdenum cofactor assembly chaperone n=1 Tax=Gordonia sesuvii TaxID=3116777 RepID=A0ABU7MD55_9ACTN|nr:nitrate reductase molybdenum cofactor assembly chaperone [Gordonia sp. LSe1-13]